MFISNCKRATILIITLATLCFGCNKQESVPTTKPLLTMAPVHLKVGEGFSQPIGYYEDRPRFSWKVDQGSNSTHQTAYRIQVASEPGFASGMLWDSHKVESNVNSWVKYQGQPLKSRQTVYWRVKIWDESNSPSNWSSAQPIEMGLLSNEAWQAQWIGHPDTNSSSSPTQEIIATPQYFRTEFSLNKTIKKARLYVTAKGLFKAFINGKPIAPRDVMTPGWTPYKKRIETLTYDVTGLLDAGNNAMAASLAGGWYSGRIFQEHESDHKLPPRLLVQLEILFDDGTTQKVVSDQTWKVTQKGPIQFASIYDGEKYQQALEMPNWNNINFNSDKWSMAISEPIDSEVLLAPKRHAPIRLIESLPAKKIVKSDKGTVIFDFGQNMVGVPVVSIPMLAGQTAKIRYAEALHKGDFYTENYRSAQSTDFYTANKTGVIRYQPSFTYHGYRYVEISGYDVSKTPKTDWIQAQVQHSDLSLANNFTSSHSKLNQLARNITWGLRSNFYDIPLDCPQRDERTGWTGDAQVFATPSMYMADSYSFWSAWLQSVREDQGEHGEIPVFVPYSKWLIDWPSSGWGDVATILPWDLFMMTGDDQILRDNYAMMKAWVDYHTSQSKNFISNMQTLGDWLQPYSQAEDKNRGDTSFGLISTAFYARSTELTLKAAEVLGNRHDISELKALHYQIRQAFRQHFFDEKLDTTKGVATQTSYLLGLAFDLFEGKDVALAQEKLISLMIEADNHLRTGFLGTPLLASVLQSANRTDLAYDLLFKETYPSWFYSVNNGATTTWERWNSYTLKDGFNPAGMNSLNHYSYGSISRWFYEGILGIQPTEPGFKSVKISPQLGPQLTHAQGFYDTPQGRIDVAWRLDGAQFSLDLTIPKNTKAEIALPQSLSLSSYQLNGKSITAQALTHLTPGKYILTAANIKKL